jgi:hypothetical protein
MYDEALGYDPDWIEYEESEGLDQDMTMAKNFNLWGNPDAKGFVSQYLIRVNFLGHNVLWHKWAAIPLMQVQAEIQALHLGYKFTVVQTYNNRNIAGSNEKSNHAWALAVDINPAQNPMGSKLITDIPVTVRQIFKAHGFRWGGDYIGRKDAMHFEYMGEPVKDPTPKKYPTTASLLDAEFLRPVKSRIAGQSFVDNWNWYGIEVLPQLVILHLETSLGSNGEGAKHNNFGNIKAGSGGKWEEFSNGVWKAAGGTFLSFPTPEKGMAAFGRFMKIGPSRQPGFYLSCFANQPYDWAKFSGVYNPGGGTVYVQNAKNAEASYRALAAKFGYVW